MTHDPTSSYWLDTAQPFSGEAVGTVEVRVDVAVIGGGLTGLSAARALTKRGATVAALKAGLIGRDLDRKGAPGHFGKPWFLPFVGAYYRFQDAIH